MKIVIAPDKFKGSLTSFEVCDTIKKGLYRASSSFEIIKLPMADGGDGLSEVVAHYTKAKRQNAEVQNPLGQIIQADWLLSADGETAFIEMAKASGLQLLKPEQFNPSITSTYGTGQLIKAALKENIQNIILGIGGSATNDAGIGMASALGYRFFDSNNEELLPIGKNLLNIEHIDASKIYSFKNINFKVACDVKNLLYGENGASRTYAPQKGADKKMVEELEQGIIKFADVVKRDLGIDVSVKEGGGAAGGLGAGCVAFLNAQLITGIDLVMEMACIEKHVSSCDILITGEGQIDDQSTEGKVISGVASVAKKFNSKLVAVCGSLAINSSALATLGFDAVFSLLNPGISLQAAMDHAKDILEELSFKIGRLIINDKLKTIHENGVSKD